MDDLDRVLRVQEMELYLYFSEARRLLDWHVALKEAARGQRFVVSNEFVWQVTLDARRHHVVRLASWLKDLHSKGGFFGTLQAKYLQEINECVAVGVGKANDTYADRRLEALRRRTGELCRCDKLHPLHLLALRENFEALVGPIRDERNLRAHPFEKSTRERTTVQAPELREYVDRLKGLASFFSDLRLIFGFDQSVHYGSLEFPASGSAEADDMVELLLLGTTGLTDKLLKVVAPDDELRGQRRAKLYDRIHAEHASLGSSDFLFNDEKILERILGDE